jgi:hypothetical protein
VVGLFSSRIVLITIYIPAALITSAQQVPQQLPPPSVLSRQPCSLTNA